MIVPEVPDGVEFNFIEHRVRPIITAAANEGIVSWTHEGDGFTVNDKELFMTMYLNHNGYSGDHAYRSFVRRMNRWGFKKSGRMTYTYPGFQRP